MTTEPAPGDVLVVRTGKGWTSRLIRVGQALRGLPCTGNHVAVLHHYTDGVPWAVEGRPGGVGWVDARRYLRDKATIHNAEQPKTEQQVLKVLDGCLALLGTPYDWHAIFKDTVRSLGIEPLWTADWARQGVPGQVVCSSAAALLYAYAGLTHPEVGHERYVMPAHWADFCYEQQWEGGQ